MKLESFYYQIIYLKMGRCFYHKQVAKRRLKYSNNKNQASRKQEKNSEINFMY